MKTVLRAAVAAAVLTAAPLASAKDLKLADFQPPSHFVVGSVYEPFKKSVETATNGEVTVTFYMGGELGPGPSEQYNRTVEGVTDIAFGLPGYTAANFPKTLLTELPGVIDAATGTDHILAHMDMLSDEYRRVALLGLWNNAPNLLLSASKPIRTLDDMKGMKIRVPSRNAGLVVAAWGATPVSMPAPDIYNAMQTGVIDGAMIDATALKAFKLAEVTKSVTQGMKTTISSFFLIMNRDSLADLTDEQQKAVMEAGKQAARNGHDAWESTAKTVLADFGSTDGKEVITLPAEEAAKFDAASAPVVERVISEADSSGIKASAFVKALKSN
nr:TRAP transporter substrate-binding protein [Jiella mangrovi]